MEGRASCRLAGEGGEEEDGQGRGRAGVRAPRSCPGLGTLCGMSQGHDESGYNTRYSNEIPCNGERAQSVILCPCAAGAIHSAESAI